jgi:hypothetical protein
MSRGEVAAGGKDGPGWGFLKQKINNARLA